MTKGVRVFHHSASSLRRRRRFSWRHARAPRLRRPLRLHLTSPSRKWSRKTSPSRASGSPRSTATSTRRYGRRSPATWSSGTTARAPPCGPATCCSRSTRAPSRPRSPRRRRSSPRPRRSSAGPSATSSATRRWRARRRSPRASWTTTSRPTWRRRPPSNRHGRWSRPRSSMSASRRSRRSWTASPRLPPRRSAISSDRPRC